MADVTNDDLLGYAESLPREVADVCGCIHGAVKVEMLKEGLSNITPQLHADLQSLGRFFEERYAGIHDLLPLLARRDFGAELLTGAAAAALTSAEGRQIVRSIDKRTAAALAESICRRVERMLAMRAR